MGFHFSFIRCLKLYSNKTELGRHVCDSLLAVKVKFKPKCTHKKYCWVIFRFSEQLATARVGVKHFDSRLFFINFLSN